MSIWILTIGNSDVQLHTNKNWQKLKRSVIGQLDGRGFTPTDGMDNRFLAPARVLGAVYSQPQGQEHWNDLAFPLLDNFIGQIKDEVIEKIILILTDQVDIFSPEERRPQHHPYWQDTCSLEPLLTTYLKDKFPQAELIPLLLKPESSNKGLDNWDYVLDLVDEKLRNLQIQGERIQTEEVDTVYVSHQAGTPAISSAVQFVSLAQFKNVEFLVSNEYDSSLTEVVPDSKYLRKLQREKAKKSLERYDYSGVKELLESDIEPEIQILLDAAILWNVAKFDEFADKLFQYPSYPFINEVQERTQKKNWWWTAYEAAYLGIVRLQQGNVVEALFHSFRALEGLIKEWALHKYKTQIKYSNRQQPKTPYLHFTETNLPKNLKKWFNNYKHDRYKNVGLFGKALFTLFQESERDQWKQNSAIQIVTGDLIDKRNDTFHCLRGLQEPDLFQAWDTQNKEDWKDRVLGCLNFIAKDDLPQEFTSLEEASLMSKVHEELEKAIASY